jgi:2-polyprenyl-3-methyl-5-hydroxy-6-metoxy-1,4-benzoquinol methylase
MIDFPFEKYSTVVDVGGGIGAFSLPLAKMHKNVKITIHDLPEALVQARNVSQQVPRFSPADGI